MSIAVDLTEASPEGAKHFDVLIVGAGISGIDAAYHLQKECPGKSFVLLETQETFGGTWNTHKYPGIRSDSDLFTFGYGWKPWEGPLIATADEIGESHTRAREEAEGARDEALKSPFPDPESVADDVYAT